MTFAPSPGVIHAFSVPGGPGVRVDTFAHSECTIPPYYDSMIAKIIVHGRDRQEAIARMRRTLEMTVIEGIKTSIPLHLKILADPDFIAGRLSTSFMERYLTEEEGQRHGSRRGRVVVRHARRAPLSHHRRRCLPRSWPRAALAGARLPARRRARRAAARQERLVRALSRARRRRSSPRPRRSAPRSSSTIAPTSRGWRGAAGVHVGQDDLPPDAVRERARRRRHRPVHARRRSRWTRRCDRRPTTSPSGPVFGTATKDTGYTARGLDLVRDAAGRGKPVVAIGGITLDRAPEVIAAGAGVGGGHHRSAARRRSGVAGPRVHPRSPVRRRTAGTPAILGRASRNAYNSFGLSTSTGSARSTVPSRTGRSPCPFDGGTQVPG